MLDTVYYPASANNHERKVCICFEPCTKLETVVVLILCLHNWLMTTTLQSIWGFMPNYFYCRAGNLRKSCEQILDNLKFRNNRVVRGSKKRIEICLKPENNVSEVDSSCHLEYFKSLRRSVAADFYFYFICNYYKYSNQYYTFPWHFQIISWYFLPLSWK